MAQPDESSEVKLTTSRDRNLTIYAVLSLPFIFAAASLRMPPLAAIPLLVPVCLIILLVPSTVIYLYFASFYAAGIALNRSMVAIGTADAIFFLLIAGYFSAYLSPGQSEESLRRKHWPFERHLLLFFIWAALSVAVNIRGYDGETIANSLWYLANILQLMIACTILLDPGIRIQRRAVISLILALSGFQMVVAFLQYSGAGSSTHMMHLRDVTGTLGEHHSFLGMMMLLSLVFSLFRALQARGLVRAAFYGAFALLSLLVLIISGSRSVLAGVAVALLVMFILRFRWKWTYILGAAGFAIGIGGLLVVTPLKSIMLQTIQSQETGALDVSSLLRLRIWQGAIDHFAEWGWFKRLVGEGIGAYSSIQYDQFVTIARRASGAHNNFLHALIETGLVGLVTFLLLFGGILALLYRRSKRDKLSLAFFYITLALLFSGLTQETFWFQPALLNFWLFYMSLLCVILRGQREGAGGEVNAASDGTRH